MRGLQLLLDQSTIKEVIQSIEEIDSRTVIWFRSGKMIKFITEDYENSSDKLEFIRQLLVS